MKWLRRLAGMLKEPSGKFSAARVNILSSILAFWVVFLFWSIAVVGLYFDAWPWERFNGAIVAGGIGLLGTIFGAAGIYAVNKYANSRKVDSGMDRWE
jgi:hypothetical protein